MIEARLPFGDPPRYVPVTAERHLLHAVLADAFRSYLRHRGARDSRSRALLAETLAWFGSSDRSALFSFESICEVLDLDPGRVRRMLVVHGVRRPHRRRR